MSWANSLQVHAVASMRKKMQTGRSSLFMGLFWIKVNEKDKCVGKWWIGDVCLKGGRQVLKGCSRVKIDSR